MSPWITYSLVRFGLFAATFTLLMVAQLEWWWAASCPPSSLHVTYIFFPGLRQAIASVTCAACGVRATTGRTTPMRMPMDAEASAHG